MFRLFLKQILSPVRRRHHYGGGVPATPLLIVCRRTLTQRGIPLENTNITTSLHLTKRLPIRKIKKLKAFDDTTATAGQFSVVAFATAEEYHLERLLKALTVQDLYGAKLFGEAASDVVHAVAKYPITVDGDESPPARSEIFFFREGSVVLWNVGMVESENVLTFLKPYEQNSYASEIVLGESESMSYQLVDGKSSRLDQTSGVFLVSGSDDDTLLDNKYTFSNAMTLSVRLGVWEASLEHYIDSIEFVTEDLKQGNRIRMTREEVLRKHGELFALRHLINLSSDLLDTPDFYWDNEQLEQLYVQVCAYFSISKRTRVMNEKLNHCVELIELLSGHLSDKHHVRLEWMIIVLIMVEVAFETIHYIDRFLS